MTKNNPWKEIVCQEDGERIDKFLSLNLDLSRQQVQNLVERNLILVNNKITKQKYRIQNNDVISYNIPEPEPFHLEPQKIPLDIIYEDDDIIVINKQNNIVVHPSIGHHDNTLVNGLLYHCKDLSGIGGIKRPGVVHRLDKKTTGLIVFAKNNISHQSLSEQFANKTATRIYYAITEGIIPHRKGIIDAPIGRQKNDRKKMDVTNTNSKQAITHFEVINYFINNTYLKLKLKTGRTHQIRVHLKYIKHPIINDDAYGFRKKSNEFGQFLHAKVLEFIHPRTKKNLKFSCPLPEEFKNMLNSLENKND